MSFIYSIFDGAIAGEINSEPDIKLSEAAMISNSNVIIEDGEIKTSTMRLLQGFDNNGNQIKIPELSFNIVSVDSSSQTIIFTGIGSGITTGSSIYLMNNFSEPDSPPGFDPSADNPTDPSAFIRDPSVIDIDNPSAFIKDPSDFFEDDIEIIEETIYNDGNYTVVSASESGGQTTIVVTEIISTDTIDIGFVFFGVTEALNIFSLFSDGLEDLFIFTKNNIYQWEIAGNFLSKLTLPYELTQDVCHWSVDQGLVNFGTTASPDQEQGLIACNGVGRPVKINADGTVNILLAEIDGSGNHISIANHCVFYENYLILGKVTLNTGDSFPSRFYNSDLLDTANFQSNDSSFFSTEGPDTITAFGKNRQHLLIFKEESIIQCFFIDSKTAGVPNIFQLDRLSSPIGCTAPLSIVNDRNNFLYFFGTDKRFKILETGGDIADVIEQTMRNIKDTLIPKISGAYIRDDNRLLWSIPVGSKATGNNKVIMIKAGVWSFLDIEVSVLSVFRKIFTDTWDTLSAATTWDNVVGTWDTVQGEQGKLKTLTTDYSGNLSTMFESSQDLGNSFTSSVTISTDLNKKRALNFNKRITKFRFYFVPVDSGDTITLSVSKDNDITFTDLTTFSAFSSTKDLSIITKAVSIRAKSFKLKFSSTDRFAFIGLIIYAEKFGER